MQRRRRHAATAGSHPCGLGPAPRLGQVAGAQPGLRGRQFVVAGAQRLRAGVEILVRHRGPSGRSKAFLKNRRHPPAGGGGAKSILVGQRHAHAAARFRVPIHRARQCLGTRGRHVDGLPVLLVEQPGAWKSAFAAVGVLPGYSTLSRLSAVVSKASTPHTSRP
ncbi:hypothetical protein G6F68_014857 [Rhizopus microsporus]|nr:hypothetical protein G6F68_014857 [Rhizopus microsporus]